MVKSILSGSPWSQADRLPELYRVVGKVNPRQFFGDEEYPVTTGRVEIGFQLQTSDPYEYY